MKRELYHFTDGINSWYYTSSKRAITYDGNIYLAHPINRSKIDTKLSDTTLTITMLSNYAPASLFIPSNPARLVFCVVRNYDGTLLVSGFILGTKFSVDDGECEISVSAAGQFSFGDVPQDKYSRTCRFELYDALTCAVDRATYAVTIDENDVTLSGISFTDDSNLLSTKPDGYYSFGYVECGIVKVFIIKHVGDELTLLCPFVETPSTDFVVYPGCDKGRQTCIDKFNNEILFGGCAFIPEKNPFTSPVGGNP